MTGDGVKEAQYLLHHGGNRYHQEYHPGPLDGVYGKTTAAATRRAWYWVGAPLSLVESAFGHWYTATLRSYLLEPTLKDAVDRPLDYKIRRRNRLRGAESNWWDKTVDGALTQVGYTETGYNETKYNVWFYGYQNEADWCGIFASYCLSVYGGRKFKQSYVPEIVSLAASGYNGYHFVPWSDVRRGDLVCYDWEHDGVADHVELYDVPMTGDAFWAVGGNTGPQVNEVARQVRYPFEVQHIVRVT